MDLQQKLLGRIRKNRGVNFSLSARSVRPSCDFKLLPLRRPQSPKFGAKSDSFNFAVNPDLLYYRESFSVKRRNWGWVVIMQLEMIPSVLNKQPVIFSWTIFSPPRKLNSGVRANSGISAPGSQVQPCAYLPAWVSSHLLKHTGYCKLSLGANEGMNVWIVTGDELASSSLIFLPHRDAVQRV